MGGIESPNSGSIEWPALGAAGEIRPKKVGIAFQGPSLLQPLTVLENVALPLLLSGASNSEARERASDLLERFALSSLDNSMPDEISGGQMQRAGLARALVVSPMLVLADEPTGQLDRATSERAVETLLSLIAPEAALVIATHDQQIAKHMNTTWKLSSGFLETEELLRSQ
jgi:putative ABC transport system ATP-binding protein/lipoprotein-releasing system ATP-binding protein